jgi:hypothetical protein
METSEKQKQLEGLLYTLVNSPFTERKNLIENLTEEVRKKLLAFTNSEFYRFFYSIKGSKLNKVTREDKVNLLVSLVQIKTMIEMKCPNIQSDIG